MKKNILIGVLACLMITSCEKVIGDLDIFNHDLALQGTVNPTLGVPVAHGKVSINDILNMVQTSEAQVSIDSGDVLTLYYQDTNDFRIDFSDNNKSHFKGTEDEGNSDTSRTPFQGSVLIDIFDNIDSSLNGASIEINNLYISLGAYFKADAREDALALLDTFKVKAFIDSIHIIAINKQGNTVRKSFPKIIIPADSLILGHYFQLLDDEDIHDIINLRPVEIQYGANMNIVFTSDFWASDFDHKADDFVFDSLGINYIDINANIKVEFPFSVCINDLTYSTDLQFESPDLGDFKLDSSMIIIHCTNGIPLSIGLTAILMDENNNALDTLNSPNPAILKPSPVTLSNGQYISNNTEISDLYIPITAKLFEDLQKATAVHIDATLNTKQTGNTSNRNVTIRKSDMLDILVTAKIQPSYDINVDLKKGGAQ